MVLGRADDYYRLMELDIETGRPRRPVLEKLDMKEVADRLGIGVEGLKETFSSSLSFCFYP